MKAAVLYSPEEMPQYTDMPEPVPQSEEEVLISVKAVALKHFDKSRVKEEHYSSEKGRRGDGEKARQGDGEKGRQGSEEKDRHGGGENEKRGGRENNRQEAPGNGESGARESDKQEGEENDRREGQVIGGDGVGLLADGTRVYAIGASGMMAERATVEVSRTVRLPVGLDDCVAAALPNAVFGAAMALRFRAGIEPGDTVLINGATGFTGRVAVQIARHYGAGRVIATGRNQQSLDELLQLGADEVISLRQTDEEIVARLRQVYGLTPMNIIIDYLWGNTAELILGAIKGRGNFSPRTRFVSVGAMAGDSIQLSAENLRSIDLQLSGSGLGSWTKAQVGLLFSEILPEMFQLAADGKLVVGTVSVALAEIGGLWDLAVTDGKRLVVRI